MSESDNSPEAAIRVQQFADKALEEIANRAETDGMDPIMLHSAFCVSSVGWLANALGPEKVRAFLRHLDTTLDANPTH